MVRWARHGDELRFCGCGACPADDVGGWCNIDKQSLFEYTKDERNNGITYAHALKAYELMGWDTSELFAARMKL